MRYVRLSPEAPSFRPSGHPHTTSAYGRGLTIRKAVFPSRFCSGKYTSYVAGSTATIWAFGANTASASFVTLPVPSLNTDTCPDSPRHTDRAGPDPTGDSMGPAQQ